MSFGQALPAGSIIGRDFRIVKPLAAGAMGAVYIVDQISTGKQRALKVMSPELANSDKARQRFVLEARVGAQIDSDHVVEVVTAGIDDDNGMPYLVMELLRGEALADLALRDAPLSVAHVRLILKQAGHALERAHLKGIVHRDIKPENIFIADSRREDVHFTAKILDFGIAKLVAEQTNNNKGTQAVGTPLYMAPEQTDSQGAIGPPADVWPLGLMAFYLLTGLFYWKSADGALTTLLREVVMDPLVPASQRAAELGRPGRLPTGFDGWFARCVDRDPGRRYPNAGEATRAFEAMTTMGAATNPDLHTNAAWTGGAGASGMHGSGAIGSGVLASGMHGGHALGTGPHAPGPYGTGQHAPATGSLSSSALAGTVAASPELNLGQPEKKGSRVGLALGGVALLALVGGGAYFAFGASAGESSAASTAAPTTQPTTTASAAPAAPLSCPEGMADIAAGNMFMGSADKDLADDVRPPHKVSVSRYCIDNLEVTVADYMRCLKSGNCQRPPTDVDFPNMTANEKPVFSTLCNVGIEGHEKHPINCIGWELAKSYCSTDGGRLPKGGARLPTEAEWEFAARGPTQRTYPWGDEAPDETHLNACGAECDAWLLEHKMRRFGTMFPGDDGFSGTAEVGSFPKGVSAAGVHDLAGNVWEWTSDWYGPYGEEAQTDPRGPEEGTQRVARGGGFNGLKPSWAKPAFRWKTLPSARSHGIGFRCAMSFPASPAE